jgi:hypothetical protein
MLRALEPNLSDLQNGYNHGHFHGPYKAPMSKSAKHRSREKKSGTKSGFSCVRNGVWIIVGGRHFRPVCKVSRPNMNRVHSLESATLAKAVDTLST